MNLFKTTFWNGIATIFKILTGLVVTKIVAIFLGPTGVALLGNFNNISGVFTAFSNGAISNGIVKYLAEYRGEKEKQEKVVSNALKLSALCAIIIGIFIIIFYKQITLLTIKDLKYSYSVKILGYSILFYSFNLSVTAILNGYKYTKYLIINNMISSFIMMITAITITKKFGLFGALINNMIAQVFICIVNIYHIKKLRLIKFETIFLKIDKCIIIKLLKFASMAIVSALVVPLSTFIIRNYIINNFSTREAGYIQGIWSISNNYLMIITTTLSLYYLPTLASLKSNKELNQEIIKGYKFILPISILGSISIYLFKDIIINILYTREFLEMKEYFLFQMIGDTFKIASFLLAHLMIAKAMTKCFIISEIIFALTRIIFSIGFIELKGVVGVTYAHALNYFIYLVFMIILFRKILLYKST